MKIPLLLVCSLTLLLGCAVFQSSDSREYPKISPGNNLFALVNIHADANKKLAYTLNYQLQGGMIPVCATLAIVSADEREVIFQWNSSEYTLALEGHTRKAGLNAIDIAAELLGPECPRKTIERLSAVDREGIRTGIPQIGMTRQGILIAMGRPPHHANPDLNSSVWMYWMNRFKRKAIEFNDQGRVISIKL